MVGHLCVFGEPETGNCKTHTWAVSQRDRTEAIEIQSIYSSHNSRPGASTEYGSGKRKEKGPSERVIGCLDIASCDTYRPVKGC